MTARKGSGWQSCYIAICHFDLNSQALAKVVHQIENWIDELKRWMSANSLSMNDSKMQYLPILPKSMACLVDRVKIRVVEDIVTAATSAQPWRLLRSSFGHELASHEHLTL